MKKEIRYRQALLKMSGELQRIVKDIETELNTSHKNGALKRAETKRQQTKGTTK